MAEIPLDLLPHTVTIEPTGEGDAYGDTYGDPFNARAFMNYGRTRVTGPTGEETTSTASLYMRIADGERLTVGTRVTIPSLLPMHVVAIKPHLDGGMGAWQHYEAVLA